MSDVRQSLSKAQDPPYLREPLLTLYAIQCVASTAWPLALQGSEVSKEACRRSGSGLVLLTPCLVLSCDKH